MNDIQPTKPVEENRKRNLLVGVIALIIIATLFIVGVQQQRQRRQEDEKLLVNARGHMAQGFAGDCRAFSQARDLYLEVMSHHFQSKDLAGKASIAGELVELCGKDLEAVIQARRQVIQVQSSTPADIKALAIAQLAAGERDAARTTLRRLPDDPFCHWLQGWLGTIPRHEEQ